MKRWFHESVEIAFTALQNAENIPNTHEMWISKFGKNRISLPHTEENFPTLIKVSWNTGFMNRQKSLFQFTNMQKICSHEAWNEDFTNRQNRIFFSMRPGISIFPESIDGKWMFSWQKLDDLLKETGWSIDGNCMVYGRKLNGLLMERLQSIYGNSASHFLHFGGLKMVFFRVLKPTVSGTPSFLHLIFCILEARKCDFAE